jgi:DNA polymerase-3 subunit epsilon
MIDANVDVDVENGRKIILDTETTGLETSDGHRIIEIGCVEMIARRVNSNDYHQYLQPDREIDAEALQVHGITPDFLVDKPRFADVVDDFMNYIKGAELIIHNAPFDIGFLNYELKLANSKWRCIEDHCTVLDSLVLAREMYPGQRNSLDALCKRLAVNNTHRQLHGALLDSQILADVYLAMTGGQESLALRVEGDDGNHDGTQIRRLAADRSAVKVLLANDDEIVAHNERLQAIEKQAGQCLWRDTV